MDLKTYPLNDTEYTAEDARLFGATRTTGIFKKTDFEYQMMVAESPSADTKIRIHPGGAWFALGLYPFTGVACGLSEFVQLDIERDRNNAYIANVVINFSSEKNIASIMIKKGVPAAEPSAPVKGNGPNDWDLVLYQLRIPSRGDIIVTDFRENPDYCGISYDGEKLNTIPPHASTHSAGGTDPITPQMIGAASVKDYEISVSSSGWKFDGGEYKTSVEVSEITSNDSPFVDVLLTDDIASNGVALAAWGDITRVTTYDGGITLHSNSGANVDFSIKLKVVK